MKTARQKKILVEELEKNPIIGYACKKAGIARATYYRWIEKNKKFAEVAEKALERGVSFMNDVAEATLFVLIKDRNLPATKYWLSHRHPAFSEKLQIIEHSELNNKKVDGGRLTSEESKLIKEAIALDYGNILNRKLEKVRTVRIYKTLVYNVVS